MLAGFFNYIFGTHTNSIIKSNFELKTDLKVTRLYGKLFPFIGSTLYSQDVSTSTPDGPQG